MSIHRGRFDQIRSVLADDDVSEPLTAREILDRLDDEAFDSAHQVATVLGRRAETGEVEVIRDQPYRYRIRGQERPLRDRSQLRR